MWRLYCRLDVFVVVFLYNREYVNEGLGILSSFVFLGSLLIL